ncbi:hypothetical protein CLOP_g12685, partial [Closterium sp. NIES-67]
LAAGGGGEEGAHERRGGVGVRVRQAGECGGRGSLDSHLTRAAVAGAAAAHAPGSSACRSSGCCETCPPAAAVGFAAAAAGLAAAAAAASGPSLKDVCGQLCRTACVPGCSDQCTSTPSLTPTPLTPITPATATTATTATAPISLPSTDSAPSSASAHSPQGPLAAYSPHHEPRLVAVCVHACGAGQQGHCPSAVHEGGGMEAGSAAGQPAMQHHMHPPHLTILTPHSATSTTTTPTPSHLTPSLPSSTTPLTTPASVHQWRRRRRRECPRRDDSDSVRRMNASLAYLSTRHSQLVHLGGADDDDGDLGEGLDVDEMVAGARLDAGGEAALLMGAVGWQGEWGAAGHAGDGEMDAGDRWGCGGECSEGWRESEMGWVECMGSAAGDAPSHDRFSGPLSHEVAPALGENASTSVAAAGAGALPSPSCATFSIHGSPSKAAPHSASSHGSTPTGLSPACLSPPCDLSSRHSPCRSSPHASPSAALPRVPCSLSHGCDTAATGGGGGSGGGSGASEGRRRSMLGMSRSMGMATLSHALSSLSHAASAVSGGSASGSPAAPRTASRLMMSSGPSADAHLAYGSTSMGSGTGTGRGADMDDPPLLGMREPLRGAGAVAAAVVGGDMEGDMGLDIDILLSDLRSRQMRSASGPLVPPRACPSPPDAHPAASMAAAAAVAVARVEGGGGDRSGLLCDVAVEGWRCAAESDSGDCSLAAY